MFIKFAVTQLINSPYLILAKINVYKLAVGEFIREVFLHRQSCLPISPYLYYYK